MMISLFIYIILFLFSFGQLARISVWNQTVNLYPYEVIMFGLLSFFVLNFKTKPLLELYKKLKLGFYFFSYLLITFFASLFFFSPLANLVAFLYLARLSLYFLFFLYLLFYLKNRADVARSLKKGFYIFAAIMWFATVAQLLFYPNLRNLIYLGWDPHLNRAFSVFFDTSTSAAIFGMIFLYFYKKKKWLVSVSFLILFILTFSRSAYLVLSATLFLDLLMLKKLRNLIFIFLAAIVIFLLVPKNFGVGVGLMRTFSIYSRLADYKTAIALWEKSPIIGYGYNHIRYLKNEAGILNHSAASFSSSYLIVLVSSGIIGLTLFVGALWQALVTNKKVFVYLMFLALLSFSDNIILHPFVMMTFGVIAVIDFCYR